MKFFGNVKIYFENIGIYPSDLRHSNQNGSFNLRNGFILLHMTGFFMSVTCPLFFESDSIIEYAYIFYSSATVAACMVNALVNVLRMASIYMFIENVEKCIEKGE